MNGICGLMLTSAVNADSGGEGVEEMTEAESFPVEPRVLWGVSSSFPKAS